MEHYQTLPASATPKISTIMEALNYIDEHYAEPLSLDSISSVFGYNKYYFSRLFNTYIGENLNNYINMLRIRNLVSSAKKKDNPNLSELVFENGFDSMTTFYRSFSKFYDRSPTEVFKKELKNPPSDDGGFCDAKDSVIKSSNNHAHAHRSKAIEHFQFFFHIFGNFLISFGVHQFRLTEANCIFQNFQRRKGVVPNIGKDI